MKDMINRVVLVGRLTKDPELRKTQNGTSVTQFTLAVNRRTRQNGQQEADFIQCTAWSKTADLIDQYLHKGSLAGIDGRIQTRTYEDQYGNKKYITEVVAESVQFLDSRKDDENNKNGWTMQDIKEQVSEQPFNTYDTQGIGSNDLPF